MHLLKHFTSILSTRNYIEAVAQRCFCEKGVLRNFAKFTRKHLCQSLFFNKVADNRLATLLKMRLWLKCFPVNFAKFLRTTFLIEHLLCLLLITEENKTQNQIDSVSTISNN